MSGSVVVLSGGLDSTVCLALAVEQASPVTALTFDYRQRHWVELDHAAGVAGYYGVEHEVVRLELPRWTSALTDKNVDVPEAGASGDEIPPTYVPGRNLIFLSVAAGVAEVHGADAVYLGVNALDYSGYPDCRPEFIEAFTEAANLALKRGSEGHLIDVRTPLMELAKAEIVQLGLERGAPLHLTWSCYRGGTVPCGRCDSCALRAKGFAEAGVADPALS
ncbi:MAG TPA: 7-cyano-7-deazaguanine synthase QueC [Acidimicrobiales bacterium]|nr:7-cyano-7-deazaguanine synthase QueC [Acidimicrobiales bacterium]